MKDLTCPRCNLSLIAVGLDGLEWRCADVHCPFRLKKAELKKFVILHHLRQAITETQRGNIVTASGHATIASALLSLLSAEVDIFQGK
jgi:hypothetical protein